MQKYSLVGALFVVSLFGCSQKQSQSPEQLFIQEHVSKLQPLADQAALAYWDGATTGKAEAFERRSALELQIGKLYTDANNFAQL